MNTEYKPLGLLERIAAGEDTHHSPRFLSNFIAEQLLVEMGQKYRAPLHELLATLQAVETRVYKNAPKIARGILSDPHTGEDEQASAIESAYLLGMLRFANHLVAISIDSRLEDVTHEVIKDETYRVLLDRIHFEGQATLEGLALFASRQPELVRTQLYRLNDLGIVGWRLSDSYGRFYYLTEPGKMLLGVQS